MNQDHESSRYWALGVSAAKGQVHSAISGVSTGILRGSFCKIVEDIFTNDPSYCIVSHADGAGTKSILAYLHYSIYGDSNVFKGIAQDAIVMNLDDLLCVGVTGGFAVTSIINRNARRVGGEIVRAVIEGSQEFIDKLNDLGVPTVFCGGETADVGDIVKTILVDSVISARVARDRIIKNDIRPGDVIVALASGGDPCSYEVQWNSGIGSNGLTAARHELLSNSVRTRFPEVFDDGLPEDIVYRGPFDLDHMLPGTNFTVLDSLLSPCRTYSPVVTLILRKFFPFVSGLVHCTGGGQLKCLRFGDGLRYVKDLGPDVPAVFRAIKDTSGMSWRELAKVFNLGSRMEIYCEPTVAAEIIEAARSFNLAARLIGHTEATGVKGNSLYLVVDSEVCEYHASEGGDLGDGERNGR